MYHRLLAKMSIRNRNRGENPKLERRRDEASFTFADWKNTLSTNNNKSQSYEKFVLVRDWGRFMGNGKLCCCGGWAVISSERGWLILKKIRWCFNGCNCSFVQELFRMSSRNVISSRWKKKKRKTRSLRSWIKKTSSSLDMGNSVWRRGEMSILDGEVK